MACIKQTSFSSLEAGESPASLDEERNASGRLEEEIEATKVGEIRSDDDLEEVEASVDDLVGDEDSEEPTFDFGRTKVTSSLVRSYEDLGYFPKKHGRAPSSGTLPDPKGDEVVVFLDFFTAGFRFPCDVMVAEILERFNVQFHQLTRNTFVYLSKFFWVVRTFGGDLNVDSFARFY